MIVLLSTAFAWQSECFINDGWNGVGEPPVCADGYQKAQKNWVVHENGDPKRAGYYGEIAFPEHAFIFEDAVKASGVPKEATDPMALSWSVANKVLPGELALFSTDPVLGGSNTVKHTIRASEMTQLPDMSFSLWDWARGNEVCPLGDQIEDNLCHGFQAYLGGLNSSHFLPQSEGFYVWYHDLALQQAQYCSEMQYEASLAGRDEFESTIQACDQLALVLEGIAQHYLQDAWSSGHMWERWGSPNLGDWDMPGYTPEEEIGRAMTISMQAGTMHGARGVVEPMTLGTWDDPMCAPGPGDDTTEYIDGLTGKKHKAIGDLYYDFAYNDASYQPQMSALLSCSVMGLREVYEESAQSFGALGSMDGFVDSSRVPTSTAACFGQRVTNESLWLAQGIVGPEGLEIKGQLALMLASVSAAKYVTQDTVDPSPWMAPATVESVAMMGTAYLLAKNPLGETDPDGTSLAAMEHTPFLSMKANSAFAVPLHSQPSDWADPPMPWGLDDPKEKALSLRFADATAWQRCDHDVPLAVSSLRGGDEQEQKECVRLAAPFVDDLGAKPLCSLANSPHTVEHKGGVAEWCADEEEEEEDDTFDDSKSLLDDGGFESTGQWSVEGNVGIVGEFEGLQPVSGDSMAWLFINPEASAAYGWMSQQVTATGPHRVTLQYRLLMSHHWYNNCADSWGDPWAGVTVDSGGARVGSHWIEPADWCGSLTEDDNGRYYGPWTELTLDVELAGETTLTLMAGSDSGWYDHNVLVDNVKLEAIE
jgi:hypothetical protein